MVQFLDPSTVEKLNRPLDEAYGLPGEAYTSEDFFRQEQKRIFRRAWVCAGHESDVPEIGDVRPLDIGGAPIILVRDQESIVRVFHNICRHKGNILVDRPKSGTRSLVCAYHCWTYKLDGRLAGTPHFGGVGKGWEGTCRDKDDLGLLAVRSHNWHGWIFVCLDKDAPGFEDYAAGMIAAFDGYDFSQLRKVDESAFTFEANWKLTFENFFDNYHVPFVHRDSLNMRNRELYEKGGVASESVRNFTNDGAYMGIEHNYPPGSEDAVLGMPVPEGMSEDWRSRIIYLHFFPNVLFFAQSDQFVGVIESAIGPDRTQQRMIILMHGEEALGEDYAPQRKFSTDFWNTVNGEDVSVCGTLQKGRASPAFDGGIFAPVWEDQVHVFQKLVAQYMAD